MTIINTFLILHKWCLYHTEIYFLILRYTGEDAGTLVEVGGSYYSKHSKLCITLNHLDNYILDTSANVSTGLKPKIQALTHTLTS